MRKKSFIVVIAVLLIALFGLVACSGDDKTSASSKPKSTKSSATASAAASINMTADYAAAREKFHSITDFWLPELENVTMLASSDLSNNQHTTARFDAIADANAYETVKAALQGQIKVQPANTDTNVTNWTYEYKHGETTYICNLSLTVNTGAQPITISINYGAQAASASYVTARERFELVTGIRLPLLVGVEVGQQDYTQGMKNYDFAANDGVNLSNATYETFKNFLDDLDGWTRDSMLDDHSGQYDKYYYFTANDDMIEFIWQHEYGQTLSVTIKATMNG